MLHIDHLSSMFLRLLWASLHLCRLITGDPDIIITNTNAPRCHVNIRVGVIMPRSAVSGFHTAKICQDTDCVPGITFVNFGPDPRGDEAVVSKESHFILSESVTDIVKAKGWQFDKVRAEMTRTSVKGMLQPVVIVTDCTCAKTVTLGPKQRIKDYGSI